MDISLKWLSDYVKIDDTPKGLSDKMTMSGSKVEGYAVESQEITGVVIGRITDIKKHPDAEKLSLCTVDIGTEVLQLITAAKNVVVGAVVPVALDGAVLAEGVKITQTEMRGQKSMGMLCSLAELGLTLGDFPYAVEDGIFLLEEKEAEAPLGSCAKKALGIDDITVEFEITSNRPDCLSVIGIAREAAVVYGSSFAPAVPTVKSSGGDINEYLKIEVQNPALCPRYTARIVKNVKIEPSPRWMRERLRASGVRPINNIVDITNYVMLEYGQPMHAFDLKHVQGSKIIVRNAAPGEKIQTLDGTDRVLSEEMLVIADEKSATAIAGVMGGEYSSILDDTNTIVFESANFDGASVRLTSAKLGMRTEASGKYEKGLDARLTIPAVQRACELVELLGAGEVVGGIIDIDNSQKQPTKLLLDDVWINKFIGIECPKERMKEILTSLGFVLDGDEITVPSWRADVTHKADIAEEVARFYGYDNIPTTIMKGIARAALTPRQKTERRIENLLLSAGVSEVMTYSFMSPKNYDKIMLEPDSSLRNSVKILNPLGEDTGVMRTSALPAMLEVLVRNHNYRNPTGAFYELATEYIPVKGNQLPDENLIAAIGMYGSDKDFYTLKGVIETLLEGLHIPPAKFIAETPAPYMHPGRSAKIMLGEDVLGELGEVHPSVAENFGTDIRLYYAALSVDVLEAHETKTVEYKPTPKYPSVSRDLALVCDENVPVGELEEIIRSVTSEAILEKVELFDVYRGSQIAEGKKSAAFRLTVRNAERTMTEKEIDELMTCYISALTASGKAALRS